jgi:hypothetical protein
MYSPPSNIHRQSFLWEGSAGFFPVRLKIMLKVELFAKIILKTLPPIATQMQFRQAKTERFAFVEKNKDNVCKANRQKR